jgi:hypothetical protein
MLMGPAKTFVSPGVSFAGLFGLKVSPLFGVVSPNRRKFRQAGFQAFTDLLQIGASTSFAYT